ncbi:ribonuclease H-like domain-containing protein [Phyllosticta capitalensis]|uniref:ribonuclease H n=1 Tax=Phyllosticta capitalensis TaxID=121624 RepID=A0ABR1YS61_9PEZI
MLGGIQDNRLFIPCPTIQQRRFDKQIRSCPLDCSFFYGCCKQAHNKTAPGVGFVPCHQISVVFTDGACSNNGRAGASAGYGIVLGTNDYQQISRPLGDVIGLKTSQRAELSAAHAGLVSGAEHCRIHISKEKRARAPAHAKKQLVLLTDSEYVVRGMTEWLPKWKMNGFRTSAGKEPANLALFLSLEEQIEDYEAEEFEIGFMHIPRRFNQVADRLAKLAAEADKSPVASAMANLNEDLDIQGI